jgi:hypothetical protein
MYDLLFSTTFGEKIGTFLENQCYDPNFTKTSSILSKTGYFMPIFWPIHFKIITSVPGTNVYGLPLSLG